MNVDEVQKAERARKQLGAIFQSGTDEVAEKNLLLKSRAPSRFAPICVHSGAGQVAKEAGKKWGSATKCWIWIWRQAHPKRSQWGTIVRRCLQGLPEFETFAAPK